MSKRLKVLFVLDSLYAGGGAERVTLNLLQHLNRSVFSPTLAVLGPPQDSTPILSPDIPIKILGKRHVRQAIIPLSRLIRSEKPHIVYSAKTHVNTAVLLAGLMSGGSARVVISEHIHLSTQSRNEPRSKMLKVLLTLLLARSLYKRADRVVCVSNESALDLQTKLKLPPHKLAVIYNPIVDDALLAAAAEALDHSYFIKRKDKPVILAVGRLTKQKGFPHLLEAFRLVRDEIPARLAIIGEGEDYDQLVALAGELSLQEDVAFLGFQPNPYKFMAHADAFILSSLWEGLPTVLVEAMACGAPVVSTRCPSGPEEIISDGVDGLLVPPADAKALAKAILGLLKDKESAGKMARAGKKRAEDFRVEKAVGQYEELFKSFLRES
jgi:glycosyltransferase involved in cell wall biosynthesis